MPSITRREALVAATTGFALLAGCTGSDRSSRREPSPRPEPIEYEATRVRDETGGPLFSRADRTTDTSQGRTPRRTAEYLTTRSELDALEFPATAAASRLRAFTSETDFGDASVFLHSFGVSECREIHLQQVALDSDGDPQVDFCRSTRPADVSCSTETTHSLGFAIRLPVDGEDSSGFGTGMSSRCDEPSRPPRFDVTVTSGGEDE